MTCFSSFVLYLSRRNASFILHKESAHTCFYHPPLPPCPSSIAIFDNLIGELLDGTHLSHEHALRGQS